MKLGVLALQGDFREHRDVLESLDTRASLVRRPGDMEGLEGLIIPGRREHDHLQAGPEVGALPENQGRSGVRTPGFRYCAGLILLARDLTDGRQLSN